jgi:hypothetical protein
MLSLLVLHDASTPHIHAGDALVRAFAPAAFALAGIFTAYVFFRWARHRFAIDSRRNRNS